MFVHQLFTSLKMVGHVKGLTKKGSIFPNGLQTRLVKRTPVAVVANTEPQRPVLSLCLSFGFSSLLPALVPAWHTDGALAPAELSLKPPGLGVFGGHAVAEGRARGSIWSVIQFWWYWHPLCNFPSNTWGVISNYKMDFINPCDFRLLSPGALTQHSLKRSICLPFHST